MIPFNPVFVITRRPTEDIITLYDFGGLLLRPFTVPALANAPTKERGQKIYTTLAVDSENRGIETQLSYSGIRVLESNIPRPPATVAR